MTKSLLAIGLVFAAGLASAAPIVYYAELLGSNETPANASPATGLARVTIDVIAHTLEVQATFAGLTAPTTASHIHCCTLTPGAGNIGVASTTPTFTGFPGGVTSGAYLHTFDLSLASSFNASFVAAHGGTAAGAEAFLAAGMADGKSYLNIHTSAFPGGEIRGFLQPVPEPGTAGLAAFALAACAVALRKRRIRR